MDLISYIGSQGLLLIPVMWVIGTILKDTPYIPDWVIPFVILALSVIGCTMIMGLDVFAIMQGILVAGASVLGHQLYKQANKQN